MSSEKLEKLEEIVRELHKINFGDEGLIGFNTNCFDDYNFDCLKSGKHFEKTDEHNFSVCMNENCKKCERSLAVSKNESGEQTLEFTSVTHGAHTFDFLDAHKQSHDTVENWSQNPVLFVMENPALPDDHYVDSEHGRKVSEWWYWVNGQYNEPNSSFVYPKYFAQKGYGWMIYSAIRTFQMANAYVTNMVKCGMTNCCEKKNYLTTDEYPGGITVNCVDNFLKRELDCLRDENKTQKVIVFAFGERSYAFLKEKWQKELKDKTISLYLLPHPANRLANDYRKYVLFGKILRALIQNDFYKNVTAKPNFEAILSADNDENFEESSKDTCIKIL